jgi:hypothetical protein
MDKCTCNANEWLGSYLTCDYCRAKGENMPDPEDAHNQIEELQQEVAELRQELEKLRMVVVRINSRTAGMDIMGNVALRRLAAQQSTCMWDGVDKSKPMGMVCNCPKCSIQC